MSISLPIGTKFFDIRSQSLLNNGAPPLNNSAPPPVNSGPHNPLPPRPGPFTPPFIVQITQNPADQLSDDWKEVLAELKAHPEKLNAVKDALKEASKTYSSKLHDALQNSSASSDTMTKRYEYQKYLSELQKQYAIVSGEPDSDEKQTKLNDIQNKLHTLSGEVKSLQTGDGGLSSIEDFDALSVVKNVLNQKDGKTENSGNTQNSSDSNALAYEVFGMQNREGYLNHLKQQFTDFSNRADQEQQLLQSEIDGGSDGGGRPKY